MWDNNSEDALELLASSDLVEGQVPIHVQQAVVPVEDEVGLWNLLTSSNHQLDHVSKVGLTHRDEAWVNICLLESCEEQFRWASIVAIRTSHHNWNSQSFQHLHCALSLVIGCSIPTDYR